MNERPTPETDEDADELASAIGGFIDRLKRDLAEAREELEDWRNAAKGAENPCPDEKHCTCVPLLHKMLADEREKVVAMRKAIREAHEAIEEARIAIFYEVGTWKAVDPCLPKSASAITKLQPFLDQ